jgi:hypothetical protein
MVRSMEWVRSSAPHTEESESTADEDRDATPSFALLDVQGPVIITYVYQLVDGEVSSSLSEFYMLLIVVHSPLRNIPLQDSSASRLVSCSATACVHSASLVSDLIQ